MGEIQIKDVVEENLDQLQKLARQTFDETFREVNTEEDMEKYLEESFNKEQIEKEFFDPETSFYFAVEGNEVIGYLKVNWGEAQTDLKEVHGFEIERIYVLSKFHGQKVGDRLFEKALEVSRKLKKRFVWLGVWEKNPRAIRFYEKKGFVTFDKHQFKLGEDLQTDLLMRLEMA